MKLIIVLNILIRSFPNTILKRSRPLEMLICVQVVSRQPMRQIRVDVVYAGLEIQEFMQGLKEKKKAGE